MDDDFLYESQYLLIKAPGPDYTGPEVISSPSAPGKKIVEQAGHAVATRLETLYGGSKSTTSTPEEEDEEAMQIDVTAPFTKEEQRKLARLVSSPDHDIYELFGLAHLNVNASDEIIKRSYRRFILQFHPDKKAQNSDSTTAHNAADPIFLAVQKAYDILSNPDKRRQYDSKYEFDDSIPTGKEELTTDKDFFDLYGPVFLRNARFSKRKPVPKLGGPKDSDETVRNFYSFWFEFDSWRDFSDVGEHNLDDAESRDERRWMESQNKKAVTKAKRTEVARLNDLVTRSYTRDPRVQRMKAAEAEAKRLAREEVEAKRKAAELERQKAEEERKAREEAEAAAAEARRAAEKARKEAEKRAVRRVRNELRERVEAGTKGRMEPEDVDWLWEFRKSDASAIVLAVLGQENFDALVEASLAGANAAEYNFPELPVAAYKELWNAFSEAKDEEKKKKELEERAQKLASGELKEKTETKRKAGAKKENPWTPEELSMLSKGTSKFPGGTRNRWQVVADFVNTLKQPIPRTPEECIKMANMLQDESAAKRLVGVSAFDMSVKMAGHLDKSTKKEMKAAVESGLSAAEIAAKLATKNKETEEKPTEKNDQDVWTPEQQTALEAALRKFPASMEKLERWNSIAAAVPGKTRAQCINRFKEIREKLLASKAK